MKHENFKKLGLKLVIAASLVSVGACAKFGDLSSDHNIGNINNQEIHNITYHANNFDFISVYYPIAQNSLQDKINPQKTNTKIVDVYGQAEIDLVSSEDGKNTFYQVKDIGVNEKSNLNSILSKDHIKKDKGVIGTYVNGEFNIQIHEMNDLVGNDPIYVGVVQKKQAGDYSQKVAQDTTVANYNGNEIHQITYQKLNNDEKAPTIYFAINSNQEVKPLSSNTTYHDGKKISVVSSALFLFNEQGQLIDNNTLNSVELAKLNKSLSTAPVVKNDLNDNYQSNIVSKIKSIRVAQQPENEKINNQTVKMK